MSPAGRGGAGEVPSRGLGRGAQPPRPRAAAAAVPPPRRLRAEGERGFRGPA